MTMDEICTVITGIFLEAMPIEKLPEVDHMKGLMAQIVQDPKKFILDKMNSIPEVDSNSMVKEFIKYNDKRTIVRVAMRSFAGYGEMLLCITEQGNTNLIPFDKPRSVRI